MSSPHPKFITNDGVIDAARAALGGLLSDAAEHVGEIKLSVTRDGIVDALRLLRDTPGLEYQQLMEIAGVDWPDRSPRFEVVY
ncbi:MAG: NADH-quinone oxidoreductase subunit C, partial [Sphingomonadales bacterium]